MGVDLREPRVRPGEQPRSPEQKLTTRLRSQSDFTAALPGPRLRHPGQGRSLDSRAVPCPLMDQWCPRCVSRTAGTSNDESVNEQENESVGSGAELSGICNAWRNKTLAFFLLHDEITFS